MSGIVNVRGQRTYPGALIEEYIVGWEVSAEIVLDQGQIKFAGLTDKITSSIPVFIELGHTYPSGLPASRVDAALDFAARVLATIGFDHGPAHVEMRVTDSEVTLIEVNPRLAGGNIPRLVELATGSSLRENVLLHHAGLETSFPSAASRAASLKFMTAPPGVVRETYGMSLAQLVPGVVDAEWHVQPGTVVPEMESNRERVAHVICCGATPYEASMKAGVALNQLRVLVDPP